MIYTWLSYGTVRNNAERVAMAYSQTDLNNELSWLALLGWGGTREMMNV